MTAVTGAGGDASAQSLSAIRRVSEDDGEFGRLVRMASLESGFDARAQASTSSARGLFQFTESTWLDMVARHGDKHGLGAEARTLRNGASPQEKARILAMRDDPEVSARMADALADDNRAVLRGRVDGPIGETELYLAHFLGAGGAARFIQAERADGGRLAAELFPRAAEANRPVFYDQGRARSLSEVRDFFAGKLAAVEVPQTPAAETPGSMAPGAEAPAAVAAAPSGPRSHVGGSAFSWLRPVQDAAVSYHTFLALAELGAPGEHDETDGRSGWGEFLGRQV
ncbi:hypothetical protein CKO28_16080 [Rhodovibrio sodomensis]|uniref:Transglycosylase SLT domain-containing protein n=1 Tax=Rhodovibrio sodomensis TaxID=1088 RepID=A0ABS1DJ75_9PROT|nr:hypothetical protein [Rhodovibrio sodomensis]MBK1669558.1 hypothetical protein [Rhodovibrio sodomensis]